MRPGIIRYESQADIFRHETAISAISELLCICHESDYAAKLSGGILHSDFRMAVQKY